MLEEDVLDDVSVFRLSEGNQEDTVLSGRIAHLDMCLQSDLGSFVKNGLKGVGGGGGGGGRCGCREVLPWC